MVCSAFSMRKEDIIVSLCGAPDWQIILWDWNRDQCKFCLPVGLNIPMSVRPRVFQISFNPFDVEGNSILLTGPCNTFKYIRKDAEGNLNTELSQINAAEQGKKISQNFTCHAWSKSTGQILVCTDNGEMVICDNAGPFKAIVGDATQGNMIEACIAIEKGFLVVVGSVFYIYSSYDMDPRCPLKLLGERCKLAINNEPSHQGGNNIITSMCLNSKENYVYAITN